MDGGGRKSQKERLSRGSRGQEQGQRTRQLDWISWQLNRMTGSEKLQLAGKCWLDLCPLLFLFHFNIHSSWGLVRSASVLGAETSVH